MIRSISISLITLAVLAVIAGNAVAETLVERGSYLVNTILACGNCHTPKNSAGAAIAEKELAGGLSFTTPAFSVTAANITPDRETGIGDWSDDDIKRALVDGARPAHARLPGTPLAAVMPANFYKALLPRDLDAIVVYLRSVKPMRNQVAPPNYLQPVHRDAYPDAEAGFTEEQVLRDPVRRGAYLVTIGHCMECHSAWARGVSDFKNGLGKGGRVFSRSLVQGFPSTWEKSTATNITSHPTAGIGTWANSEIKRAITKGIARDGRVLNPPMAIAWYSGMTESDLDAIIAWLRTVPPLD